MAEITGVEAASWQQLIHNWWQFVLIAFILVSLGSGSTYVLYLAFLHLCQRYLKRRSSSQTVPSSIKRYLSNTSESLSEHKLSGVHKKPGNYGVYLGHFDCVLTEDQEKILVQWELLIVDPSQPGVLEAISSAKRPQAPQVIARLDISKETSQSSHKPIFCIVGWITSLLESFAKPSSPQSSFTGILLSNWNDCISSFLITEIIRFINSLGLSVYLETSAPVFLADPSLAELPEVTGLVICNGTISSNGEERDAFQMAEMRPTIKAFVSQACLRSFVVLLWETVEDDATPSNAVIKRCYQWSRFYSALPWVGSKSALTIASLSLNQKEPLGAFDWLKELQVMKIHDQWRGNQTVLASFLPHSTQALRDIASTLCIQLLTDFKIAKNEPNDVIVSPCARPESPASSMGSLLSSNTVTQNSRTPSRSPTPIDYSHSRDTSTANLSLSWLSLQEQTIGHPISTSPRGQSYDYLGCFPIGFDGTRRAFHEAVETQRRLLDLKLLDEVAPAKLESIGQTLSHFCSAFKDEEVGCISDWLAAIQDLAERLSDTSTDASQTTFRVHIGLDSGFQMQPGTQFWAVYSVDDDSVLNIFISRDVQDVTGVILHTFLSSLGCPRHECFQAEIALASWSKNLVLPHGLPRRMMDDIVFLSPSEQMKYRQVLALSPIGRNASMIDSIGAALEATLLKSTDLQRLKRVTTTEYLSRRVSAQELVASRIQWYDSFGCDHPVESEALACFIQAGNSVTQMLKDRDVSQLSSITKNLARCFDGGKIDSRVDLIALSIFCAMRSHAFDEAYLEVTDRNTLFNDQSDQAAAFAELFATGARCGAYFDVTPSAFGKLLSDRYRAYHHKLGHEPPIWSDSNPSTPSAYAAAKIDVDPNAKKCSMSAQQRFTFLSVFAIPALLDILLLTTTGRGLYLSGYMTHSQQHSATLALMISLLISGAVGTWITCGGTYYLVSMVFSAMNLFVITRLVGGLAFTLAVAAIGMAAVGAVDGVSSGIIFSLYLIALTSYLCLLASLANFQYPGSAFQSGRPIIVMAVPFLFISPVVTIWVQGYDIYIYLSTIYVFLILLVLGVRHTASLWTTWYLKIEKISDKELRKWYIKSHQGGDREALVGLTEPGILKLARDAMFKEVQQSLKPFRRFQDPLVSSLAKSYEATVFLMEWYSGYSGTPLPMPYSSTWNMQTKVALQTLKQLQTGIRLHNAFIHWRQAGDEVGCTLLYFIVALIDKWSALLAGGQLLGLSAMNTKYRMPVGFALAYYLIGAVLLDFNAAKLHTMTAKGQNTLIADVSTVPEAVEAGISARRYMYCTMLGRYLLFHVWSLAVASSLLWLFDGTEDSTILFVAYVGAYTGLLWFQYTKIFAGPRSLKPLLVAVAIGLPLGQILRHFFPDFMYCDVTTLGVSTWTAAFLSLYFARIKSKYSKKKSKASAPKVDGYEKLSSDGIYHEFSDPGKESLLSQDEMRILYENLRVLPEEEKYKVDPQTHPGVEIKSVLGHALGRYRSGSRSPECNFALAAFPEATELLEQTMIEFETGHVEVYCIPMSSMNTEFPDVKAISYTSNNFTRVIIGSEMANIRDQKSSISLFCHTAAEIMVHAVAENLRGFKHADSALAEVLVSPISSAEFSTHILIPQRFKNCLVFSDSSRKQARSLVEFCEDEALNQLALNTTIDTHWEQLPRGIRDLMTGRCIGLEESLTPSQIEWLMLNRAQGLPVATFMARRNFGVYVALSCRNYALGFRNDAQEEMIYRQNTGNPLSFLRLKSRPLSWLTREGIKQTLKVPFSIVYHKIGIGFKLFAIAFVAEPELQRELDYALKTSPNWCRKGVFFLTTIIWTYSKILQDVIVPVFLLHGRKKVIDLWRSIGGSTITMKRSRIVIKRSKGLSSAFIHSPDGTAGTFKVHMYDGNFDKEPTKTAKLQRISTYNKNMLLLQREEYDKGTKGNVYTYEYPTDGEYKQKRLAKVRNLRYPILRRCVESKEEFEEVIYNTRGLVQSGSYMLHGSLIQFNCHYRQDSNFEDELLRAQFVLPHLTCTVSWSAPPATHQEEFDKWIPHSQVTEASFVLGSDVYEAHWSYDHRFNPTIHTTLNGESIETPPIIQWDHLGVLKKPTKFSFLYDDPLISFKSLRPPTFPNWLGLNTHYNPVSTSRARSRLWRAWKEVPGFDGVVVRWLDEKLLRKEPLLRPYWRNRDRGNLIAAEQYLNDNADGVVASVDLDNSIAAWAPLAMQLADLYSFGQGGDANSRTRSKTPDFDNDGLQVLAVDSGTWPNEGGGVSACRRDMINNLRSVKWHMIAESANDFGLPKHQTHENVQSLKVIPLWGLDFLTPTHGLFKDRLDTEVEHVPRDATKLDIKRNFVPILKALVKGARTSHYSKADILQTTRALVNLNTYFSESKHWGAVWTSTTVKDTWRKLWVSQDLVSPTLSEGWFQTEFPTVAQLDAALELWYRYLFIFSIPIPDRIPAIFQASHHSVSASYGIVCKIKRGCTLQIWDHAISWRETNLYLSSDLCSMAPFIRNALLGLMRITSQLILHHADTILPCADFFNPGWEVEIGTNQGHLENRNTFRRKIDPVVNGIPDMTKFAPIKEIKAKTPTVTMLSHVWYAKDIKSAILAADIIVNEWGFTDYRLNIYGAIDKAPSYSTDCFEIIASKSLPDYVCMCGEANPTTVLENTWVFLNSSISEGLPLALGEAALTGAPVVCTDVGASLRVLTDPDTQESYSAVVAPNDARNLARAQINFLALLNEWAPYADDAEGTVVPSFADKPTPQDVIDITRRMYEKAEQRRTLGMKSREIVQKSFGGERYLREHEQMLWIGKSRYDLLHKPSLPTNNSSQNPLESATITSNLWGSASLPSASVPRRPPISSVQTNSVMRSSFNASTLTPSEIRSFFDGGINSNNVSKASTLYVPFGAMQQPPLKKAMPVRMTVRSRNQSYEMSERIPLRKGRKLPREDSFVRDLTVALEQT